MPAPGALEQAVHLPGRRVDPCLLAQVGPHGQDRGERGQGGLRQPRGDAASVPLPFLDGRVKQVHGMVRGMPTGLPPHPRPRGQQTEQRRHQRGLARTAGPQEHEHLPRLHVQVDLVEHAEVGAVDLGQGHPQALDHQTDPRLTTDGPALGAAGHDRPTDTGRSRSATQ
nr:hypothetical protein [Ornithinimicrobium pratense]